MRDTAERAGGGVADRDMTWEERKRRFNYSYLLQQKESERGGERHRERDRKREIERERDWPKWGGIPRAVVHSGSQSCATLGPWVWGNSSISCQKTSEGNVERGRGEIFMNSMKTSPLLLFCFLNSLFLLSMLNSLFTFPRVYHTLWTWLLQRREVLSVALTRDHILQGVCVCASVSA